MAITKRFDRALFEANDKRCRDKVKELLAGIDVRDNPKKMGVDLQVFVNNEHMFNIECESKSHWAEEKFQYEDLNLPARKEKYTQLDKPTLFIIFSKDLSNHFLIPQDVLVTSPKVEVKNRYVYNGELFFKVDLKRAILNGLKDMVEQMMNSNIKRSV